MAGIERDPEFLAVLAKFERATRLPGRGLALLHALDWCALNGRPAPAWLASRFRDRLDAYDGFEVTTLDEAFDAARPKGMKLDAARSHMMVKSEAPDQVSALRQAGMSAKAAIDSVAATHNISVSLLKALIRERKNDLANIVPTSPAVTRSKSNIYQVLAESLKKKPGKTKKRG